MAPAIWTIALVALIFLLRAAASLLIPLVLAVLVSYALEPVVAWLVRRRLPRAAAAGLVVALVMGSGAWAVYSARDDAAEALQSLPDVARQLRDAVWSGHNAPGRPVQEVAALVGQASSGSTDDDASNGGSAASLTASWMYLGVGSLLALLGHAGVVTFLVFFLLLSGDHVGERVMEVVGPDQERRRTTARILAEINQQLQRFLLVRLATAVVVAAVTWPVLAWLGVAQPGAWALLAGVFNSIPYAGPIVVSGGLLVVVWAQSADPSLALTAATAALVVTALEGWLLTPVWLGRAERMHVLAVFLGVLFWTWVWGPWGTVLAVPMLVVVKAVADRVESLKPFGRLLAP